MLKKLCKEKQNARKNILSSRPCFELEFDSFSSLASTFSLSHGQPAEQPVAVQRASLWPRLLQHWLATSPNPAGLSYPGSGGLKSTDNSGGSSGAQEAEEASISDATSTQPRKRKAATRRSASPSTSTCPPSSPPAACPTPSGGSAKTSPRRTAPPSPRRTGRGVSSCTTVSAGASPRGSAIVRSPRSPPTWTRPIGGRRRRPHHR